MESTLKRQLKAWQREFRQQHGREPSRKDMDKVPHVAAIYDQWHASQGSKPKASSSSSSASKQDSKKAEQPRLKAAREKTRRPLVDPSTPSKRRPAGGGGDPFKTPTKPASASKHYSPSVNGSGGSVVDAGLTTAATLASPSAMTPSRHPKVASPWGSTAATWSYYGETPSSPALAKALASPSPSRLTAGPTSTAAATVITPSKSRAQRERLDRAIMQLEYTPRTKARKRLRGEAVPKTPAARRVASGPAGKRRGARGLLVVDEEDDDGDGSEVRDRRPEKRQKSQGQTRTLAQFGFGAVGGKGKRAADEVDDDDEEEACLGPSPNRANRAKGLFQGSEQASSSSYQPLFGPASSKRQWLDDDEKEEEGGEGESEMEGEGTVEGQEEGAFSSTSSSTSSPRSSAMDTATLLHRQRGSLSSPPTEMTPVPMEDVPMHDASLRRGSRAGLDREEQGAARTEGGIALKPYRLFERPVRPSNSFSDDDDEDEDGEGWPGLSRRPTTTITVLDDQEAEEEEEDIKIDGLTLSSPSAQGKSARRARRIRDEEVLRRLLGDSSALVLEEGYDGEEKWDERGKNVAKTASTTWGEAKGKNNTGPKKGAKKAAAIAAAAEKLKEEEARREERKENLVFKTMARAGVGDAEEGDEEAEAGADEWDSEVDEAEYGLGDGYMDEVDVI